MTYQEIKKLKQYKRQEGVTLLLAILVLSAILAIAFSLATITFIEIRSSGDLVRTEPAYYAADAVSEEALYKVKRNVPDSQFNYTSNLNNVSLGSPVPTESQNSLPIFQLIVPKGSNSFSVTRNRYPIFDPACPSPDTTATNHCSTGGSGYGKIKLTYTDTGNDDALKIYLCQFDPTGNTSYSSLVCSEPTTGAGYWTLADGSLLKSNTQTLTLNPNLQQELIVYNGGGSSDIYVQLESFGSDGVTPRGLPLVGQKAVDINAASAGVVRKIRTLVPTSGISSGGVIIPNVSGIDLSGSPNAYAQAASQATLNITNFTVEAWIYPRRLNYGSWQSIVAKENSAGTSRNFGMYVRIGTSKLHYSFQASNCSTYRSYDTTGNLTANAWNHIAITYDGTNFRSYINGVLDSTQTPPAGICTSNQPVWIGGGQPVYAPNNAIIDEVRVWNLVRSQSEISANRSLHLTGTESGLVSYWKFNENSGNSAANSVSGGNAASFGSQAAWTTTVPFP